MFMTKRILPYTKQLVLLALYDVLDEDGGDYRRDANGNVSADVRVYGNKSGFSVFIGEQPPATELTVAVTNPCGGLSEQGKERAADYIADRVEQLLENELKINALIGRDGNKNSYEEE